MPVHNGTLKLYLIKPELGINVYEFKKLNSSNAVTLQSDLRIYTAGKHKGMIRIKYF